MASPLASAPSLQDLDDQSFTSSLTLLHTSLPLLTLPSSHLLLIVAAPAECVAANMHVWLVLASEAKNETELQTEEGLMVPAGVI